MPGVQMLSQSKCTHQDRAHGDQEGDQQEVGRTCGREKVGVQDIAERGREHRAAKDSRPGGNAGMVSAASPLMTRRLTNSGAF